MRRWTWPLTLILTVVAAWPAVAAPADKGADEIAEEKALLKKAKSAIAGFKRLYRSKDPDNRCNALLELMRAQHPSVVVEMGKVMRKERNAEVRTACAMVLGDMTGVREEAGAVLRDTLELCRTKKRKEDPEVLKAIGQSIGNLGYKGAHEGLLWMLDHLDQWVVVSAIVAIRKVGDLKALPKLHDMAAYQGVGFSWETGSVTVDTGASGDTDQKAAEAAWKKKYGHIRPKKAGPTVVKLYMRHLRETVEKLTGQKFKNTTEFKAWIDAHQVEVGLKPPPKEKKK